LFNKNNILNVNNEIFKIKVISENNYLSINSILEEETESTEIFSMLNLSGNQEIINDEFTDKNGCHNKITNCDNGMIVKTEKRYNDNIIMYQKNETNLNYINKPLGV